MERDLVLEELKKMSPIEERYMMGTKAYHQLGDISSDEYDIFYTEHETPDYYVGSWITGLGFFNVLFPKDSSRPLTEQEKEHYNKQHYRINSQPSYQLDIK